MSLFLSSHPRLLPLRTSVSYVDQNGSELKLSVATYDVHHSVISYRVSLTSCSQLRFTKDGFEAAASDGERGHTIAHVSTSSLPSLSLKRRPILSPEVLRKLSQFRERPPRRLSTCYAT